MQIQVCHKSPGEAVFSGLQPRINKWNPSTLVTIRCKRMLVRYPVRKSLRQRVKLSEQSRRYHWYIALVLYEEGSFNAIATAKVYQG